MKEFKVTKTMTKAYLGDVLKANANAEGLDKSLTDRVSYTLSHFEDKSTTRNEVAKLVKELATAMGDKFTQPPLPEKPKTENLVKKPSDDKGAKTDKKTKDTKSKDTKDAKKPAPYTALMASAFPETIEVGGFKFNIDHSVKTIKDFAEDKEYELAFYWAARHLHQFAYQWHKSPENPKGFPNDLDTAQLIYTSDDGVVAYCVSDTTEGIYTVYPQDLEEFEGIRYCNGIEYQIYSRAADESGETEAEAEGEDTDEDTED